MGLGLGQRQVERPGLLGIRTVDGGEVGIGLRLCGHDVRGRESGPLERGQGQRRADAVQRRVDDPDVARLGGGQRGQDRHEVGLGQLLPDRLAAVAERHVAERADRRDLRRDLRVGRRRDLRPVAEVDLVAVVLRGIVARGHHHARRAAELQHAEGEQRRRDQRRQAVGRQPGAGEDRRGLPGEARGAVAGVVADHDAPAPAPAHIGGEPGARLPHGGHVHARRARAQGARAGPPCRTSAARRTAPRARPPPRGRAAPAAPPGCRDRGRRRSTRPRAPARRPSCGRILACTPMT